MYLHENESGHSHMTIQSTDLGHRDCNEQWHKENKRLFWAIFLLIIFLSGLPPEAPPMRLVT
jgi:hypothetical protein